MDSAISMPQDDNAERSASLSITTPARPTLDGLPLELQCHIAAFLSPISKALFALTCRCIYHGLDTDYVEYLRARSNSEHRQDFLEILEEDLPEYVSCGKCLKLHHVHPFDGPQCAGYHGTCTLPNNKRRRWCQIFDSELDDRGYIHRNFSHIDYQKVMKLHRRGRDTTKLLDKLSLKPFTEPKDGHINQINAVARILGDQERGSLVIRQQSIWLRCTSRGTPTPNWLVGDPICPHYYVDSIEPNNICLQATHGHRCFIPTGHFQQCHHCCTEFRIDEKDYGAQCSVLFITQWVNFGRGRQVGEGNWVCRAVLDPKAPTYQFIPPQILSLQFENKGGWDSVIDSLLTLSLEDETALFDEKSRWL